MSMGQSSWTLFFYIRHKLRKGCVSTILQFQHPIEYAQNSSKLKMKQLPFVVNGSELFQWLAGIIFRQKKKKFSPADAQGTSNINWIE